MMSLGPLTRTALTVAVLVIALTAAAIPLRASPGAVAQLEDGGGQLVGLAFFTADGSNLQLSLQVEGLPSGTYPIALYSIGRCNGPDFTGLGERLWLSDAIQSSASSAERPAGGQMLAIGGSGKGALTSSLPGLSLGGAASLLDRDGSAIVIEPGADVPSSSQRAAAHPAACGVLRGAGTTPPSQSPQPASPGNASSTGTSHAETGPVWLALLALAALAIWVVWRLFA